MCYHYHQVSNFSPFCSATGFFQDMTHFIVSIDYLFKQPKTDQKIIKNSNLKFRNSFYNLQKTLIRSIEDFGIKSAAYFQKKCRLKNVPPCGAMLTKNAVNNFGRNYLALCMIIWELIWCVPWEKMSFEIFTSMWSHVNG